MNYTYHFPAVKGHQAGRDYFTTMVPLKLLSKLFPSDLDMLPAEYRAQRVLNESRIPEIKKYILDNRNAYVFSALAASISGKMNFVSADDEVGFLDVDMNSSFMINDGQHRKAAIEAALEEDETLGDETIPIVFFMDEGLERNQQMFTDLNKHAVKTSNSLSTLYDSRDEISKATKEVIDTVPFFSRYTDKERDILGKNSSKLFTISTIYKANKKIVHADSCSKSDIQFLIKFWKMVSSNITEWQMVLNKALTKKDLKESYIVTLAVVISAFGKLGRYFYDNKNVDMSECLPKLCDIDWSRTNPEWVGRAIRYDGKVLGSDEAVTLISNIIKESIDVPLSKDEIVKEKKLMESRTK